MNTKNDLILRGDAIAALGDAPMNCTDTPEEIQAVNDWQAAIEALGIDRAGYLRTAWRYCYCICAGHPGAEQ